MFQIGDKVKIVTNFDGRSYWSHCPIGEVGTITSLSFYGIIHLDNNKYMTNFTRTMLAPAEIKSWKDLILGEEPKAL